MNADDIIYAPIGRNEPKAFTCGGCGKIFPDTYFIKYLENPRALVCKTGCPLIRYIDGLRNDA